MGLLAACGGDAPAFVDAEGLASCVVVDVQDELVAEAHAVARGDPVVRPFDAGYATWVLGYQESLDALDLPFGRLTLGDAGAALPTPLRAWRVDAEGARVEPLAARLSGLRVAERTGCRRFASRSQTFPRVAGEYVAALLPLARDAALLTTSSGRFIRLGREGAEVLARPEGTPYQGGWSGRGRSWLVGPGFASGSLDGFELLEPSVPIDVSGPLLVDGPHDEAAPFELFALDPNFGLAHFDGLRWRRILDAPASPPSGGARSLAWVAPGRAAIVGLAPRALLEVDAEGVALQVPIDVPPNVRDDSLWRVAWVDGVGPLVGTRNNVVFARRADGGWRLLPTAAVTPRADVFLSLGDGGFLSGGMDGVFGQWTRLGTTCTLELVGVGDSAYRALRLDDDLVFVSEGGDEAVQYTWMTPLRR